eukprot:Phypoly_transcript_10404.p1 GENE.Phypoly_transcript_10404~~Phypoly_transcript_10404.p1  ORF type:complete len:425 (+),score=72.07 Phypoly_transcript_10404:64-1275(+)
MSRLKALLKLHLENCFNKAIAQYADPKMRQDIAESFAKFHFKTMRATILRDGVFKGFNFNGDIGSNIVHCSTIAWKQLFKNIREYLTGYKSKLLNTVEPLADKISMHFYGHPAAAPHHQAIHNTVGQQWDLLDNMIVAHEKTLDSSISNIIRDCMKPSYKNAVKQHGRGAKIRMTASLAEGVDNLEMYQNTKVSMFRSTEDGFLMAIACSLENLHKILCIQIEHQYSTRLSDKMGLAEIQTTLLKYKEQLQILVTQEEDAFDTLLQNPLPNHTPSDSAQPPSPPSSSSHSSSPLSSHTSPPQPSASSSPDPTSQTKKLPRLDKNVKSWDPSQVRFWLTSVGLEKFASIFEENGVDGDTLLSIKKEDLKDEFHFKLGDVITLWKAICELRESINDDSGGFFEFV